MTSTRPTNRCVSWDTGDRLPRRSHGASHSHARGRRQDFTLSLLPVASVLESFHRGDLR
jgi:hypothetical protein